MDKDIKDLAIILMFILFYSFFFDSMISYAVYKADSNFFISHEINHFLTDDLKNGKSFFSSDFFKLKFLVYFSYFIVYFAIFKFIKDRQQKKGFLIFFSMVILFNSFNHFLGGFSWIIGI